MKVRFNRVYTPRRCEECLKNAIEDSCNRVLPGGLKLATWYEGDFTGHVSDTEVDLIRNDLISWGLEVVIDRDAALVDRIEKIVIEKVRTMDENSNADFFAHLTNELPFQRSYLSRFYSKRAGRTLQHFILMTKMRRVKEMLVNEEAITLTDIAFRLHFSSVAHLSKQFKKFTGSTPSHYRKRVIDSLSRGR